MGLCFQEREELERKVEAELRKQESLISVADIESGLVPRTKRRCVIVREQMSKKKEWWEEEGLGSDDEDEEDIGKIQIIFYYCAETPDSLDT